MFDHLGRLRAGVNDPAFAVIRRMLDNGRTWMKLSGAYMIGGAAGLCGGGRRSRGPISPPRPSAWCGAATGRIRPRQDKPDDAVLFDLLSDWAPDEATRQRILVDNPAKLYGFDRLNPAAPPSARGSWAPSSVPSGWSTTAPA